MVKETYLRFGGLPIIVMEKCKPSVVISVSREKRDDVPVFIQNFQFKMSKS